MTAPVIYQIAGALAALWTISNLAVIVLLVNNRIAASTLGQVSVFGTIVSVLLATLVLFYSLVSGGAA